MPPIHPDWLASSDQSAAISFRLAAKVMSAATMHDGSVVSAGGAPCGAANAYPYFYFLQGITPK